MKGPLCFVIACLVLIGIFGVQSSINAQDYFSQQPIFYGSSPEMVCSDGSCSTRMSSVPLQRVISAPVRIVQRTSQAIQAPVRIVQGTIQATTQAPIRIVQGAVRAVWSTTGAVVNRDSRAFEHAQQEANLQAQYGKEFHALGCAPGTNRCGVGSSFSVNEPNHCTFRRAELVARAYAVGNDGKVYWSAHYRR